MCLLYLDLECLNIKQIYHCNDFTLHYLNTSSLSVIQPIIFLIKWHKHFKFKSFTLHALLISFDNLYGISIKIFIDVLTSALLNSMFSTTFLYFIVNV